MRMSTGVRLLLVAVIAATTLVQCSRSVNPNSTDRIDTCPPDTVPQTIFETRPGLAGLKIVPIGEIEFKVQSGTWIDFKRVIEGNQAAFVEVTFRVKEDGTTEIKKNYGPGFPKARSTVRDAILSWKYTPSCFTPTFKFIFSGSQGFSIADSIWGDPIGRCIECPYTIKGIHRVHNYAGYQ
jgi:hypothetical protein